MVGLGKFFFSLFVSIFLVSAAVSAFNETAALSFLKTQQSADGYFDLWFPPHTAMATIALSDFEGNSSSAYNASQWMVSDLQNSASWSWAEADIPGTEIYALALAGNADASALSGAYAQLLSMQANSGGFIGWWTAEGTLEDVASTAWSVLGLNAANALPASNASNAKNFLLSLQNADGSFKLASSIENNSLSALAPDKESATAIALLALHALGENSSQQNVSLALSFLKNSTESCFGNQNHSYSAAVAALAFNAFNENAFASKALNYLKTLQAEDGSFLDGQRFAGSSAALDTGIALHASRKINETIGLPACLAPQATPTPTPTASPSPTPCPTKKTQVWVSTVAGKPWIGHFEEREIEDCANSQESTAQPGGAPAASASPITVKIDFPANSGQQDISQSVSTTSCNKAYECFSKIASLSCTWSSLGCFVTAVNGVQSNFGQDGSWWSFKANGALASVGVSYYDAKEGDVIELALTTQTEEVGATPAATPMPTPAPVSNAQSTANATATATPIPTAANANTQTPTARPAPSPANASAASAQQLAESRQTPPAAPQEVNAVFTGNESETPAPQTGLATATQGQNTLLIGTIIAAAIAGILLFARGNKI